MRSYEEVTNHLLERRDRYMTALTQKRKRIAGVATTLFCCCLVALTVLGIWHSSMHHSEPPAMLINPIGGNPHAGDKIMEQQPPAVNTNTLPSNHDQLHSTESNNKILILEIETIPVASEKMYIALMRDDFIPMNQDEMIAYYGVNIFPSVPSDLEVMTDPHLGIYKRKTNGELYHDGNKISYANEDHSRGVAVNVDKNCMPFDFYNLFGNIQARSIINSVEVGIAQTAAGELYAEFMYQNTGFRICAHGLTQDEFISIIESLLE